MSTPYLTVEEAAAYLQVGERTIRKWARSGKLRGRKVGQSWRFTHADLDAVVKPVEVGS